MYREKVVFCKVWKLMYSENQALRNNIKEWKYFIPLDNSTPTILDHRLKNEKKIKNFKNISVLIML